MSSSPSACCCSQPVHSSAPGAAAWVLLGCLLATACWLAGVRSLQSSRQRHRRLQAVADADWDPQTLASVLRESLPAWVADPQLARQPEWINTAAAALWPHVGSAVARQAKCGRLEALLNSSTVWRPRFLAGAYVTVQGVYLGQVPPRVTGVKVVQPLPLPAPPPQQQAGSYSGSSGASGSSLGGSTARMASDVGMAAGGGAAGDGVSGGQGSWAGLPAQESFVLDCDFSWSSRMEVKLLFKLIPQQQAELEARPGLLRQLWKLVSHAAVVKIGVRNVVVQGRLRVTLGPLLGHLPVVAAASLSLMGAPEFSYLTTIYGGSPFVVPGLEAWINSFIRTKVLAPFVFPSSRVLPVPGAPPAAAPRQDPEGLLEVQVLQAKNVPRMNLLGGKADPFVRLWVRESSQMRTSVRSHTLSPAWDEQFTLIVHSVAHQCLTLALFDSDTLLPDEEIGRVQVPLSNLHLSDGAVNDLWLPLVPPHKQHKAHAPAAAAAAGGVPSARQRVTGFSLRRLGSVQPAAGPSSQQADRGGPAASTVVGREDVAGSVPASAPAAGPPQLRRRSISLEAIAAALTPGKKGGKATALGRVCQVHVQVSFSAFSRQEREAARAAGGGAAAGGRGIVPLLQRLSRESLVPSLLRSGVLSIHLEKAEGLPGKTQAGFTRHYKVRITVGGQTRVTERGKLAFYHKRDPVFDESLEMVIDGDTASAEGTAVELQIFSSYFLRADRFKGRVVVPLREVQRARRLRGSWPLQDAPSGSLLMELSWAAAAGMWY